MKSMISCIEWNRTMNVNSKGRIDERIESSSSSGLKVRHNDALIKNFKVQIIGVWVTSFMCAFSVQKNYFWFCFVFFSTFSRRVNAQVQIFLCLLFLVCMEVKWGNIIKPQIKTVPLNSNILFMTSYLVCSMILETFFKTII